ncbi:hypothetical protein ILUMI_14519, partial [Ignelater luminosus]
GKTEVQGTYSELFNSDMDLPKILAVADENGEIQNNRKQNESPEITPRLRRKSALSTMSQISADIQVAQYKEQENNEEISITSRALALTEYYKAGGNIYQLLLLIFLFVIAQVAANGCDFWVAHW